MYISFQLLYSQLFLSVGSSSTLLCSVVSFFMTIIFNSLSGRWIILILFSSFSEVLSYILLFGAYPFVSSHCLCVYSYELGRTATSNIEGMVLCKVICVDCVCPVTGWLELWVAWVWWSWGTPCWGFLNGMARGVVGMGQGIPVTP